MEGIVSKTVAAQSHGMRLVQDKNMPPVGAGGALEPGTRTGYFIRLVFLKNRMEFSLSLKERTLNWESILILEGNVGKETGE